MKKTFTLVTLLAFVYIVKAQSYFREKLSTTYGANTIYSLEPTANNTILMAADARLTQGLPEAYIGELNSSGDLLWDRSFLFKDGDAGTRAIQTSDGGYALLTLSGYFVKLKADHSTQYIKKIKFQYAVNIKAYDFVQTADSGYMIAGANGQHPYDPYHNMFLFKIDSLGNYVWSKNVLGNASAYSISKTKSGGYLISGKSRLVNENGNISVVKTDGAGNIIYAADIADGSYYSMAYDAEETSDGGCLVTGESNSTDEPSATLVAKLNASGTLEWTRTIKADGPARSFRIFHDRHNTNTVAGDIIISDSTGANIGYQSLFNFFNDGTLYKKSITSLDSGYSLTYVAACRGDKKSYWFGTTSYTGFAIVKSDKNGKNCTAAHPNIIITSNEGIASAIGQTSADYPGSVRDALSVNEGEGGSTVTKECVATEILAASRQLPAQSAKLTATGMALYPNPASGFVRINGLNPATTSQLFLTDVKGKLLAKAKTSSSYYNWNISKLSSGIYFVRIVADNKVITLKLIKH